jgi:hypothetical protein
MKLLNDYKITISLISLFILVFVISCNKTEKAVEVINEVNKVETVIEEAEVKVEETLKEVIAPEVSE